MIIRCKLCNKPFESLIVDRQLALKELTEGLMKHVGKMHQETFSLLGKANGILATSILWYNSMQELALIDDSEEFIIGEIDKIQDNIMMAMGFDPEDDEDMEDDDEGEDGLEEAPIQDPIVPEDTIPLSTLPSE